MRKKFSNPSTYGCFAKWFLLLYLVGWFAGCAATRKVYAPPERQKLPPKAEAPQQAKIQPLPSQRPIFKAPAEIKETDVLQAPGEESEAGSPQPSSSQPAKRSGDPQYLASMQLVDQAEAALVQGDADSAIASLEQAIQVDVYNGEAFFGLARAWRLKGLQGKALEFANKAEILFQDNPKELKQVYLLKAGIYKELHDVSKTDFYLQKAARLE